VERITKLYLGSLPFSLDDRDPNKAYDAETYDAETGFFWVLWSLLLMIVRMIPYNHPKQELLVKFLRKESRNCYYMDGTCFFPHTGSSYPRYSSLPDFLSSNPDWVD
jgi:hypothetical protein